nr:hypothetical protein [Bacteroidales bacterium]
SAEYLAATNNLWKPIFDGNFDFLNGQITHYTAMDITAIEAVKKDQSTYRLSFDDATSGEWGNCNFLTTQVGHFIPMTAGTKYKIKVTLGASADVSNVIFSLHEYKADDPDQKYEGAWLYDLFGPLTANTPSTLETEFTAPRDIENISFTIIPQNGTPAGMLFYIKDLIIEEIVPSVPAALAGTYKVTNLKILGGLYIGAIEEFKDKSWMWNSSINKEYDNLLVVNAEDATVDYQPGDDGAYWDYVLIADKNKLGTGDLDVSANFAQLPHEKVSLSVDMTTGNVTIGGTVTAQAYMPGEYSMSVDWCSTHGNFTVPEGSIALAFKCANMPQETYSGLDQSTYLYTDFDRFAIHPFAMIMIFAKQ